MTTLRPTTSPEPEPPYVNLEQLASDVLTGAVEPATRRLLNTASNGDPVLLRALVVGGLGDGTLTRHEGRWKWVAGLSRAGRVTALVEARATAMKDEQLGALRTITAGWAEPYAVVTKIIGDRPVPDAATAALGLTRREREILVMLGNGLNARTIARRLCLSVRTVAKHQERVYRKLGTSDRLTTVLRAQRLGLLRPAATPFEDAT